MRDKRASCDENTDNKSLKKAVNPKQSEIMRSKQFSESVTGAQRTRKTELGLELLAHWPAVSSGYCASV